MNRMVESFIKLLNSDEVKKCVKEICGVLNCLERNRLFFVGNGGSAAIALHMAADYQKNAGFNTQTFFDPALLTMYANDYGYESVFSKPLSVCAQRDDILIAISSSGNSPNIVNAVMEAKNKGCKVITLSGFNPDNQIRQLGDVNVYVPVSEYGIVESIHNLLLQQVIDELKVEKNRIHK